MTVEKYLERIGLRGPLSPTRETLFALQKAHLFTVPYENLDILAGVPLSLNPEDLYEKIVDRKRGGYCFELNELFAWLLRAVGYQVTDYFARFLRDVENEIPKRRHHVLRVKVEGENADYLCDVGVGSGSPTYPVKMVLSEVQVQGANTYRFAKDPFLGWVLEEEKRGAFVPLFSFTEEPQLGKDFITTAYYCEYAEDSPFNKAPMVAMRFEGGRQTLDGWAFKRFVGDQVEVMTVDDPAVRDRILGEWFGLRV